MLIGITKTKKLENMIYRVHYNFFNNYNSNTLNIEVTYYNL